MNTTPFMDKQIMDLTQVSAQSETNMDLVDLMKHPSEKDRDQGNEVQPGSHQVGGNGIKPEDILSSFDFQRIRPRGAASARSCSYDSAPNIAAWNSDSKSILRNYNPLDSIEPAKAVVGKDRNAFDATVLSKIDQTVKKHMENLHHVLEGVSARLTQLESRTHHLENSMDDLKVSAGNNYGSTDGKMRQLENILREVQTGVQALKDKQDIVEAQLQLAKLQLSKTGQQTENQTMVITDPVQQIASAPQQSQQLLPSPVNIPQSIASIPSLIASSQPPLQQGLPPSVQQPNQFPQNQIPSVPHRELYFPPPPVQSQEAPNQQYQPPLHQQPHPPSGAPSLQYQQTPQSQYPQPATHPPQPQLSPSPVNPPQLQSSLGHHVEETAYVPSQNFPPNLHQPPSQPPTGPPPSQQFFGPPTTVHEPPSSRSGSGFSSGYGAPSGPPEPYQYGGSPQYGGTAAPKPPPLPTAAVVPSVGGGYPQLPTARVLPLALPTASGATGGSGSAGTGNRVPIDDVIDKVASMGFPRDHVSATVRKLTENGQSVDLNVVLDKLMNEGEVQPPKGWFGR